ncbi:SH3 domain-containing protein [Marinospirillum sp.]|uniref:SH3 domain-containing protein n=1 Tax=Marinospirillum sp. TaxID=2183934 RepID=UPI002870A307|nr:SH3 domain-containing protein [Marinospirillum sp.]MDR9468320.1 SH3 domain-containing protein [Marinospirillum sp.]
MNGISRQVSRQFLVMTLMVVMASFSLLSHAEIPGVWRISVPMANVRAAPQGELVDQIPQGQRVTVVAREGAWLQVELDENRLAWMHQVTLTELAETSDEDVELFGLVLQDANRSELRTAIRDTDVTVVREVDAYPYDLYDPSDWWPGATEMVVGYLPEEQLFAIAEITFRSHEDTEQVREIAEQVQKQLGPWQRVLGRRAEGPVEFEWQQGGLRIMVHRSWPDTTTYLTYEIPERFAQMQEALDAR